MPPCLNPEIFVHSPNCHPVPILLARLSQGRLLISNYRMKFQVPKGTLKDKLAWPLGKPAWWEERRSTLSGGRFCMSQDEWPVLFAWMSWNAVYGCLWLKQWHVSVGVLDAVLSPFDFPASTLCYWIQSLEPFSDIEDQCDVLWWIKP